MLKHLKTAAFIFSVFVFGKVVLASEIGYVRSQSSTSISDKYKLTYNFNRQHKTGVSYRTSRDATGVSSEVLSALKLSYRYKTESTNNNYACEYKKSTESYSFDGQSLSLKANFDLGFSRLPTKLNLSIEGAEKKYSKSLNETLLQRMVSIGFDQELTTTLNWGVDYSGNYYSAKGEQISSALLGDAVSDTNISSYVSSLSLNAFSTYLEYSADAFTLGASYSVDSSLIGGRKTSTTEIYGDITFFNDWSLSLSFLRGRQEDTASISDSVSAGVSYSF